jgi:23S rRNA (guanosine2251-2'-O)-methyltransferase
MKQLSKVEVKRKMKEVAKRDLEIFLILENIQYATNVASIFRTADAAGVRRIYLTGISQKPPFGKELQKTSRRKEDSVPWIYKDSPGEVIQTLKKLGYKIIAIELTDNAVRLDQLNEIVNQEQKICFVAGSEVYGITKSTLEKCDAAIYIPMYGKGASLNVSTSVGITLFSF